MTKAKAGKKGRPAPSPAAGVGAAYEFRADSAAVADLLDLGAGTGHLLATAWTTARKSTGIDRSASLHFVDSNPPAFGRSFGLARDQAPDMSTPRM